MLTGAAEPDLFVGALFKRSSDAQALRIAMHDGCPGRRGPCVRRATGLDHDRGMNAAAVFAGGVLGTSTSLTGVPPALLLTRRGIPTKPFLADLATYFVATSSIGLAVLRLNDLFSQDGAEAILW